LLLKGNAIPEKYPEDALHIAVAARHGIDVIVTWNFKHINNPFTRMMVRQLIENNGFVCPEICSPDEFVGEEA
jgi:predicted nucleic acid-binding protein